MADLIELDLVVRDKGLKQSLSTVERLERQIVKAAKAVDQNRISQDRYNKVLLSAKREYQALGVSSQKATAVVRKFAEENKRAMTAVNGNTQAQMAATKQTNRMGVVTQQTGYQVSDFIVQVQSGTSPFVAFGQQASQLVGILPLMSGALGISAGALIGVSAALGIVIPLITALGMAFSTSRKSTKDASEVTYAYGESTKAAASEIRKLTLENYQLAEGVENSTVAMLDFAIKTQQAKTAANDLANEASILFGPNGIFEKGGGFTVLGFEIVKTDEEKLKVLQDQRQAVIEQNEQLERQKRNKGILLDLDKAMLALEDHKKKVAEATEAITVDTLTSLRRRNQLAEAYLAGGDAAVKAEERLHSTMDLVKELQSDKYDLSAEDLAVILQQVKATQDLEDKVAATKDNLEEAKEQAQLLADALSAATGFSSNLDQSVVNLKARLAEAKGEQGAVLANTVNQMEAEARLNKQRAIAAGEDEFVAKARLAIDLSQIEVFKETTQALEKQRTSTKKLGKTTTDTMSDAEKAAQAYADSLDNTVVSAVGSVSDAWADFVMRGFKDFGGFVDAVLNSFKNMIGQMIAIAAKNRIMLSLGMGGVAPSAAMAGQGLLGGTGILGGGGAGIGAAVSGVGQGLSGVTQMGGFGATMGQSFSTLGGLASGSIGGFGAIGAALPAVGALVAGASVLKSIFGGKDPVISSDKFEPLADAALLTGQSFRKLAAELEGVDGGIVSMSRATQSVIKSIADATGGLEEFAEKANFFFSSFYTETEQKAYLTGVANEKLIKTFDELGVAVPRTHEEYRRLVSAQDLATESGRKMYEGLLNAANAFVAVNGTAEQAAEAAKASMEARSAAKDEYMLQTKATRFMEQNEAINRMDEVGTTLAQNEYLLNQFVEDYNVYVDEFNAKRQSSYDPSLSKITRESLEQMTDIDDVLAAGLEATSSIQSATFEWYEGTRKTRQNIINEIKGMIEEDKATSRELTLFKTQGEIPESYMKEFGKYGMFEQLPYVLELTMFVKERIQEIGMFTRAATATMLAFGDYNEAFSVVPDAMMDLNDSLTGVGPEIEDAAKFMGQLSANVVGAFDALRRGFEKISEAVGKVNTFYKDQFSALAAEYNVQDVATESIDISGRMTSIIAAPARLITVIEDNMAKLQKKQQKLNSVARRLESEMNHMTFNGIKVSDELADSYEAITYAAGEANRAADKARKEIEALKLYVSTVTQAVQDFESSVEKMLVEDLSTGVNFFEPNLLSDLTGNTRILVANILKSITEGGYEAFEEGFVRLTDLFTDNSLTVDQFNQSFGLLRDVFEGNISLTEEYTTKQAEVVDKLSSAYDDFTSKLQNLLGVVSGGISTLLGQTASANLIANRVSSLSYLSSIASGGSADAGRLERAVGSVTSGDLTGFGTRQDFLRYVADTTNLLRSVEGVLEGQLETLEMQQVKAILGIEETSKSAAESLMSVKDLLAEFLGAGGRIPQFASGGYHSGGLRIVGENGPELEATGPSRIFNAKQLASAGGDNSELSREVAQMRVDLKAALVQIAKNTRKSSDTLNKFDYQGLPESRGY